jgi:hypothetical protein
VGEFAEHAPGVEKRMSGVRGFVAGDGGAAGAQGVVVGLEVDAGFQGAAGRQIEVAAMRPPWVSRSGLLSIFMPVGCAGCSCPSRGRRSCNRPAPRPALATSSLMRDFANFRPTLLTVELGAVHAAVGVGCLAVALGKAEFDAVFSSGVQPSAPFTLQRS